MNVRQATTPVLLVRPHEKGVDLATEPEVRHILIPLDGSALAEHVLAPATDPGGMTQGQLTLLRVYGPGIHVDPLGYAAQKGGRRESPAPVHLGNLSSEGYETPSLGKSGPMSWQGKRQ